MAARNTVIIQVELSVDRAMSRATVGREIRSRINDGCCHSYEQQALKVRRVSKLDADALAMWGSLQNVEKVYHVEGIRTSTDAPFSWYVVGPKGEVAHCQTDNGEEHAGMIAAALNDRVAMCRITAASENSNG